MISSVPIIDIIYVSLFYLGICSAFLYSAGFEEIRDGWWDYFSSKKNFILHKIAYLAICPLCLAVDVSLVGNTYFFPELGLIDSLVLAFVNGAIVWGLASCIKMFINASWFYELSSREIDCRLKCNEKHYD